MFNYLGKEYCPLCHGTYPSSYNCMRHRHLDVGGGKIRIVKPARMGGTDNIAHGWHWAHVTSIRDAQIAVRKMFPQFALTYVEATKLLIGELKIYRGSQFTDCSPNDFKYVSSWQATPQMYTVIYLHHKYTETTRYVKPWFDGEAGLHGNVFYDVLSPR
jgi:hypothetical protein